MSKLTRIPIPTVAAPAATPVRTTRTGLGYNPRKGTEEENLRLIHARRYNKVTRGLSILNQGGIEE